MCPPCYRWTLLSSCPHSEHSHTSQSCRDGHRRPLTIDNVGLAREFVSEPGGGGLQTVLQLEQNVVRLELECSVCSRLMLSTRMKKCALFPGATARYHTLSLAHFLTAGATRTATFVITSLLSPVQSIQCALEDSVGASGHTALAHTE